MKRVLSLLVFALLSFAAGAQTTVFGNYVRDSGGALLVSGQWCLGASCLTVTNGQFSGTVTPTTATVTIVNASSVTVLSVSGVVVSPTTLAWDGYVVSPLQTYSGYGNPYLQCQVASQYTQIDSSPADLQWFCVSQSGKTTWQAATPSPTIGPGLVSGVGAPAGLGVVPTVYIRTDVPQQWNLSGPTASVSSAWAQIGSNSGTALLNPAGTQDIVQPPNTFLDVNNFNQVMYADPNTNSCTTTSGGSLSHNGDCAFYLAVDQANTTGKSVDLYFGNGTWNWGGTWTEPTGGYAVNIHGSSISGTKITAVHSAPTTSMLVKTGGSTPFYMSDITWNTSGNAGSCFDLTGGLVQYSEFVNINCIVGVPTATSGINHGIQIGASSSYAEHVITRNVLVSSPQITGTYAAITGTLTGTALTALSCSSCGNYSTASNTAIEGVVNDPNGYCTGDEPTFTPTLASGTSGPLLTTVGTITHPGTCTASPSFLVMQDFPVTYAAVFYTSDSTHYDLQMTEVGTTCGGEFFGGNTTFVHFHPVGQICGGIATPNVNNSQNYYGTELDTIGTAGLVFATQSGVGVYGTMPYVASSNLPGTAVYQFQTGASNIKFIGEGNLCAGANQTIQERFINNSGQTVLPGSSGWPANTYAAESDLACTRFPSGSQVDFSPNTLIQTHLQNLSPLQQGEATIASATSISPVTAVVDLTGNTTINTVVAPSGCTTSGTACQVTFNFKGSPNISNSGNVALAYQGTVGNSVILTYDPSSTGCTTGAGCWYPPPQAATPLVAPLFTISAAAANTASLISASANVAILYGLTAAFPLNSSKISYRVGTTADNTSATYDFGLYTGSPNATCSLLADTGAIAGTTATPTANTTETVNWQQGTVAIPQGNNLYVAVTTSQTGTPATLFGAAIGNEATYTTAHAIATGGTLPATVTCPSVQSPPSQTSNVPWAALQ